jgi:hypothetical protein
MISSRNSAKGLSGPVFPAAANPRPPGGWNVRVAGSTPKAGSLSALAIYRSSSRDGERKQIFWTVIALEPSKELERYGHTQRPV